MTHPFYEGVRATIDRCGVQLIGVAENPPFTYTIGNHEYGYPELLVIGANTGVFGHMLSMLIDIERDRKQAFEHGELISLGGSFPVKIINTTSVARDRYAVQAYRFYREDDSVRVQQVVLCDKNGRYPDEIGCAPPFSHIPILY